MRLVFRPFPFTLGSFCLRLGTADVEDLDPARGKSEARAETELICRLRVEGHKSRVSPLPVGHGPVARQDSEQLVRGARSS